MTESVEFERRRRYPLGAAATLAELENDPYPLFARLRTSEPVSWLPALRSWVVTSRELALQVCRDPDRFSVVDERMSVRAVLGDNMLTTDRPEQDRHRRPFASTFRLAPVREAFTSYLEDSVDSLIRTSVADKTVDLRVTLAGPLAVETVTRALGLPSTHVPTILDWYGAFAEGMTEVASGRPLTPASRTAYTSFSAMVEPVLTADEPSLLRAVAAGDHELAPAEVIANAALIMFGGIETTESLILNAFWLLLTRSDQMGVLRRDPTLVDNAIEEALRIEAAVVSFERFAAESLTLGGVNVASREMITVMPGAANRDPSFFANPDQFDITRQNAKHNLAFGAGPHVCLGMHLARLEARICVRSLLSSQSLIILQSEESVPPRGLAFRKPDRLVVTCST